MKSPRFNERAARVANGFERARESGVVSNIVIGPAVGDVPGFSRAVVEDSYLAGRRDRRDRW